jgi:hypothetical protein
MRCLFVGDERTGGGGRSQAVYPTAASEQLAVAAAD